MKNQKQQNTMQRPKSAVAVFSDEQKSKKLSGLKMIQNFFSKRKFLDQGQIEVELNDGTICFTDKLDKGGTIITKGTNETVIPLNPGLYQTKKGIFISVSAGGIIEAILNTRPPQTKEGTSHARMGFSSAEFKKVFFSKHPQYKELSLNGVGLCLTTKVEKSVFVFEVDKKDNISNLKAGIYQDAAGRKITVNPAGGIASILNPQK